MGRFSLTELDDSHHEEQWEFVADPGEEGALVCRGSKPTAWNDSSSRLLFPRNASQEGTNTVVNAYEAAVIAEEEDFQQPKTTSRSFTRLLYYVSMAVMLVGWLLPQYLPPAPPSSLVALFSSSESNNNNNDDTIPTWNDFLSHHSYQFLHSLVALTVHVPFHVSQWFFWTLSTDVHLTYERFKESNRCRKRRRAPSTTCTTTNSILSHFLAGQPTAVRIVSDTVETWQQRPPSSSQPLLLFFTGFPHTGKTTLAHALMEHVLWEDDSCPDPLKRILVMQGQDFSSSFSAQEQRDVLMHQMTQHVRYYSSGSMILIQQIEDMDPDLLTWLVRTLLARSSDASSVFDPSNLWKEDCCPNTVFVFSSDTVGRTAIARALRQGNLHSTDAVFLADLFHSIDSHFPDRLKFQSRSWFDAVVPFQPLTRDSLGEALSLQVAQQLHHHQRRRSSSSRTYDRNHPHQLILTQQAKDALLDPKRVEYLEWKRRDRPEDDPVYFMTVAIQGAQILDEKSSPLWKQLVSSMNRCLFRPEQIMTASTTIMMDYTIEGDIVFQMCQDDSEDKAHTCTEVCLFSILWE